MYNIGRDAWLPLIGESYEFVDDKTIRIKIRDEAKWNDGVPITAYDKEAEKRNRRKKS